MTFTRAFIQALSVCFISALLASCGNGKYFTIKKYPKETPFVYDNKIEIVNTKLDKNDQSLLNDGLTTQLEDNMQLKIKTSFLVLKKLIEPAAFDTLAANRSRENMEIYLKTKGFYNGKVSYTYKFDTSRKQNPSKIQLRATTKFIVSTGPVFKIDSTALIPLDSGQTKLEAIHLLANQSKQNSYLKKGVPFTEELISAEMNRLIEVYRNNGYYYMTRDQLYADVDTVFLAILDPNLLFDPIRQFEVFQEAQRRRENPPINVYIRAKPNIPDSVLQIFTNRSVTVYPSYENELIDSAAYQSTTVNGITVKHIKYKYKPAFIARHIYIRPDSIYRINNLYKTSNELNKLNQWQVIKIQPVPAKDDSLKIDYNILLTPSKRYRFSANLESVFNQTQSSLTTAGNLVGFGVNIGLDDKNIRKLGIQMNQVLRAGIEFGVGQINSGIQSAEVAYSNTISIPRIPDWILRKQNNNWLNKKTFISTTISIIDRNINNKGLFALNTVSSTFGWQFQTPRNSIWQIRPLNIEYVKLYNESVSFINQKDTTPFLKNSFNQGLIIGNFNASYSKPQIIFKKRPNNIASFKLNFEESGALFGRLKKAINLFDKELFEYIRFDSEFKYVINKKKTNWVLRTAIGAGYLYGNDTSSMPFFKQFAGGGPNSMRAWPLRSIGPGASVREPRTGRNQFFSRAGDMIFEANAEYRYNIFTIWPNSLILRGALFVDAGNVWNFRNKNNIGNDTVVFQFKNFYRDLSVSAGTGFRLDFVGLFLIRFDFGLRIKNPAFPGVNTKSGWRIPKTSFQNLYGRREQDRNWRYENFNFSLGIGYPF